MHILVWKRSIYHILSSDHNGSAYSSIYYRRAEDVSIEFHSVCNGHEPVDMCLTQFMGKPLGVWTMDDWHRIDNQTQSMLLVDNAYTMASMSIHLLQC
eukprot:5101422-Amphidinium_carterae.2